MNNVTTSGNSLRESLCRESGARFTRNVVRSVGRSVDVQRRLSPHNNIIINTRLQTEKKRKKEKRERRENVLDRRMNSGLI